MSPVRTRVPEDTVKEWQKLHKDGWDLTAIGKQYGVDRRIVAKRIREYERREMMYLDETARRDLAVKKLDEHFKDLELAAQSLWRLSVSPMRTGRLRPYEDDYSPHFPDLLSALRHELRQVFVSRWGQSWRLSPDGSGPVWRPQDPVPEPYESEARRQADNLIAGLKEHFPEISSLIDDWNRTVKRYRETWLKLEHEMVGQGFSDSDVVQALEEFLRKSIQEVTEGFGEGRTRGNSGGSGLKNAYEHMYQSGDARDRLPEMTGCLRQLESISTQMDQILGLGQIRNGLLKTRCRYCTVA